MCMNQLRYKLRTMQPVVRLRMQVMLHQNMVMKKLKVAL